MVRLDSRRLVVPWWGAIVCLVVLLNGCRSDADALGVSSAVSLRGPVEAIVDELHQPVHVTYGGSAGLLARWQAGAPGDLFLSADPDVMAVAVTAGLVRDPVVIASQRLVLVVAADNPLGLSSLHDLANPELHCVWPDPRTAAAGRIGRHALRAIGLEPELSATWPDVASAVLQVATGVADVCIGWDTLGDHRAFGDRVMVIPLPEIAPVPVLAAVGSHLDSTRAERAQALIAAWQAARTAWLDFGFVHAP